MKNFKNFLLESDDEYTPLETTDFATARGSVLSETILGPTNTNFDVGLSSKVSEKDNKKYGGYSSSFIPTSHSVESLHDRLSGHYNIGPRINGKISDLPEGVNKTLKSYTSSSGKINSELHHMYHNDRSSYHSMPGTDWPNNHIKALDSLTRGTPAPHDFHIYTGLHGTGKYGKSESAHPFDRFGKGQRGLLSTDKTHTGALKAILPAFTSTSINYHVAEAFTESEEDEKENTTNHIIKMHIPKGSKHGMYIAHHSTLPVEREFLLKRGTKLHIHPIPEIHLTSITRPGWSDSKQHTNHIWHARIVE